MTWFDVLGTLKEGRHAIGFTHPGAFGVSVTIEELLADCPPERTLMADLNVRLEAEVACMVASGRLHALPADDPLSLFDLLVTILCPPGSSSTDTHHITQFGSQ